MVINCNVLTVTMFRMYKATTLLSALLKVYSIPCHDRGHINFIVVLQSCTDSTHILAGSSSVTYATLGNISTVKVEEDIDVIEESFIAINKEVDIGIKQEEIPKDITFPDIKAESDEVGYVCVCVSIVRHLSPVSRNVICFCPIIFGQFEQLCFWEGWRFFTRWVGLE